MFKKLKQRIEENDVPISSTPLKIAKTRNSHDKKREGYLKNENKWEKRFSSSTSLYSSRESINSNATVSRTSPILSSPGTTQFQGSSLFPEFTNGVSREKLISELEKKSDHIRNLERRITELAASFSEQTTQKESLEDALQTMKQEVKSCVEAAERKCQHKISMAKEELEWSMRKKDKEFEEIIKRKDEEITRHRKELSVESRRNVDVHDLTKLQQEEISRMKEMLIQSQAEMTKKAAELFEKTKHLENVDKQYMEQRTELDQLQTRLDDLARERSKYGLKEHQLSLKIETLEKERDALQSQMNDALCEMSEKSNLLEIAQKTLKRTQEETVSLRETYKLFKIKAKEDTEKVTLDNEVLRERIQDLEQRIKDGALSKTDQYKAYEKERELYESRLQETRNQLADQKFKANEKINTLGSLISSLDDKLKENTEELHKCKKAADDKVLEYKTKATSLENQLNKRTEELDEFERKAVSQIADYEKKLENLQRKLEYIESSALKEREYDAKTIANLQEQVAEYGKRLATANEDSTDAKAASERAGFFEAKNKLLESRLKEANNKAEVERLKSDRKIEELQKKIELISCQFEQSSRLNVETLESKIEEQDRRIFQYKKTTEEVLEEKEKLKAYILTMETDSKKLMENLRTAAMHKKELEKKIEDIQVVLKDRDHELHSLRAKQTMNDLGKDNEDLDHSGEIRELQITNKALLAELENGKKKMRSQQQKLSELQKACQKELSMKTEDSTRQKRCSDTDCDSLKTNDTPGSSIEVNFTYLKHVILKYMCSTNDQSRQLIGVISHLLQFTPREETIVKECIEWKLPTQSK